MAGLGVLLLLVMLAACSSATDGLLVKQSGGEGTTDASNQNAFGNSARNLTDEERRTFEVGDSFFTQNWVIAPSSTAARDGLGPLFNAQSCSSCHLRDGRGSTNSSQPGLLFRLGVPDQSTIAPDPAYGDQLQDRSILDVPAEGEMRVIYTEQPGTYTDGSPYTLHRPVYTLGDLAYGDISIDVLVSPRLAPAVIGDGLLEAIPVDEILKSADPDDMDGDGISGRPNWLIDPDTGDQVLGRFGWKANVATVRQQVASAFLGDLGITSSLLPDQNCTRAEIECALAPDGGTPEVSPDIFDQVVFYSRTLAVPARRNLDDPGVIQGAVIFRDIGCESCHQSGQTTGESDIEALAHQVIYPFTDLLLHDMGPGLADHKPDGSATGTEWRTAPLWGIGLTETVNGHMNFLHDGRGRTLEEAILWHGGEAASAADGFKALDRGQRAELIDFLNSL
jgi:CxxC motif-containing protein (DUF1111 family)